MGQSQLGPAGVCLKSFLAGLWNQSPERVHYYLAFVRTESFSLATNGVQVVTMYWSGNHLCHENFWLLPWSVVGDPVKLNPWYVMVNFQLFLVRLGMVYWYGSASTQVANTLGWVVARILNSDVFCLKLHIRWDNQRQTIPRGHKWRHPQPLRNDTTEQQKLMLFVYHWISGHHSLHGKFSTESATRISSMCWERPTNLCRRIGWTHRGMTGGWYWEGCLIHGAYLSFTAF